MSTYPDLRNSTKLKFLFSNSLNKYFSVSRGFESYIPLVLPVGDNLTETLSAPKTDINPSKASSKNLQRFGTFPP